MIIECGSINTEAEKLRALFKKCYNLTSLDMRNVIDLIESVYLCSSTSVEQGLQSVLDTGNTATQGSTGSYQMTDQYFKAEIAINPGANLESGTFNIGGNVVQMGGGYGHNGIIDMGSVTVEGGLLELRQQIDFANNKKIRVRFQTPLHNDVNLLFPTKEQDGEYVISTLDDQNNFVRHIFINAESLSSTQFTKQELIDAVLVLPAGQRTILSTDSVTNIGVGYPASGGNPEYIYEIYELQNQGKGVITSISEENLLFKSGGIDRVLELGYETIGKIMYMKSNDNTLTTSLQHGIIDINNSVTNNTIAINNTLSNGARIEMIRPNRGVYFNSDEIEILNFNEGKSYNINLPNPDSSTVNGLIVNFPTDMSSSGNYTLALREDVDASKQKVITYPGDFISNTYVIQDSDHNHLIFVQNGVEDVEITTNTSNLLRQNFFCAFIQEGTGEVFFTVGAGLNLRSDSSMTSIKGQYSQAAIDKKGTTTNIFLTGKLK